MLVTIFSDASICPNTGCVGWAAWARSDRGITRGSGALRRLTIDSAVAEAMALVNGMAMAHQAGLLRAGDVVVAQTDNNSVMEVLHGRARRWMRRAFRDRDDVSMEDLHREVLRRNEEIDEIAGTYAEIVERLRLNVRWRHCKGHRGTEDRRAAVNSDCDARAYGRMTRARLEHRGGPLPAGVAGMTRLAA